MQIESGPLKFQIYRFNKISPPRPLLHTVENPAILTPIAHANLALNNADVRGQILMGFPLETPINQKYHPASKIPALQYSFYLWL
jgi:hypothetical protein